MMYRVDTRIPDYEMVQESPYTLPSMRILNKVLADMQYFLNGQGVISSWRDVSSNQTVVRGERTDIEPLIKG